MKKTTQTFKDLYFLRVILPAFKWKGNKMVFPYYWCGEKRYAVIEAGRFFRSIKWDVKKL